MFVKAEEKVAMRARVGNVYACRRVTKGSSLRSVGFRLKKSGAVAAVLLAASPAWAGIFGSAPPMPDWVREAAKQTLPEFPRSTRAVVLLEDETYTVGPDGRAVDHVRKVVKILRPQGRKYGVPFIWYDKDSKVLSMHVWSIDPAGHEYSLKDNEITDFSPPGSGEGYGDERAKTADPPGLDPGGVVAFEYEVRERPYLSEANWFFQGTLPRVKQVFTLALPAGFNYTTTWANHDKVDGADLENHSYRWEMNDERGIDLDDVPLSPATAAVAGRMTVHYSGPGLSVPQDGTWQGIGQWYDSLAHDRLTPSPDVTAKAAELTAGKTDFFDKAAAIGEFVQKNIRYFTIDLGVGGYQPHAAGDTFRGRYGDCKDKATLMVAMLSSVGIHGALMMVHTDRYVVNPDDPSIVGNHMIGAIEIPKGYESPKLHSVVTAKTGKRYLIFDPTWDQTPFGQLESNLQASYGVLMEGPDSQVIQLPVMDPDLNTIKRSANFELTADGSLKGTVVEKRYGDVAEYRRYMFTHEDQKTQQERMDRIIALDFAAASMSDLKVDNAVALDKELTTSFSLSAMHFATATGPLLMVRPRVLGRLEPHVDHKKRRVAIDLDQTMRATDEYEIQLPEGYVVDELPDPVKADFGFASYESSTKVQGRKLHYTRTYVVRDVSLPASKYPEVQKLAEVIAADEESQAVLKRGN